MLNVIELKKAIVQSGKTKKEIATVIGITEMGFYKKANAITEFKASEIVKLKNVLGLSEEQTKQIFFAT